jgi:CoA binding domain
VRIYRRLANANREDFLDYTTDELSSSLSDMSGSASRRNRKSGFLRHRRPALNTMFAPESIALIGATEAPGSVGRALLENLKSYHGPVYPVNLRRHTVLGLPAFPKIGAVPGRVDLAIIATPAATVPDVVQAWYGDGQTCQL